LTLAEYMIPSHFVHLAALPLTPNGKVDRKALPPPGAEAAGAARSLPATPTEERLAAVWREVLGDREIGRDDNFFEIGGNSLLLIKAYLRLCEEFPGALRVTDLFAHPSLAGLAAFLEGRAPGERWRRILRPIVLPEEYSTRQGEEPGGAIELELGGEICGRLASLAAETGTVPEIVLLSLIVYLLTYLTGQKTVHLQYCGNAAGRARPLALDLSGAENLPGLIRAVADGAGRDDREGEYLLGETAGCRLSKNPHEYLVLVTDRRAAAQTPGLLEHFDLVFSYALGPSGAVLGGDFNLRRLRYAKAREIMDTLGRLAGGLD
ncbi:MAG: phosphopantetheine-binding protein, partial [Patescibacteria group bacterium]